MMQFLKAGAMGVVLAVSFFWQCKAHPAIDAALSFEDRSGATMFFEHVNFQPRASKAQLFLQNGPYCQPDISVAIIQGRPLL